MRGLVDRLVISNVGTAFTLATESRDPLTKLAFRKKSNKFTDVLKN